MEEWNLRRHTWLRFLGMLPFLLLSSAVCLLCANIAYVFMAQYAFGTGIDWLSFICGLLLFLFAVLFAFISFGLVRESFSQVVFSSQGVEQRRFGKSLCFLPWDKLAETGIALEKWTTKSGPHRCLYFADWHLDEFERAAIDETLDDGKHAKGGKLVKVPCKGIQNEEILKRICPVPIPSTQKTHDIKQNLHSYRRARNADGSWGNPEMVTLPDANKIVHRYRILQRENKKGLRR